jgi:hypothetical protein
MFDYEISKRVIIHMDFIEKQIPSIMIFKKMHPSFYLSFKIEFECSQMYEHQLINGYNHKL